MQRIGEYRLLEQLGAGGNGIVYRAVHEGSGEEVALKTVKVPSANLLQGIRREIHALARIRHPGIVRIVAEGVEEGLPWYAMELLEGSELLAYCQALRNAKPTPVPQTLTDLFSKAGRERVSSAEASAAAETPASAGAGPAAPLTEAALRAILTVVRRLCGPLAYLHGEGLVHRDLKPANVMVRPDGQPVLVDFGLVTQFGGEVSRDALEISGAMVGTAPYMAPEQIRGELVDARADLYSLGCVLYELLTGRRPFVAKDPRLVLRMHLETQPEPPSTVAGELPRGLDDLLARLLAKRPADRLGYADDVSAALSRLGAGDEPLVGPTPRPYLYRPGFWGRDEVLEKLENELFRLEEGKGNIVFIGGESGVGKTRLALELMRSAMGHGMRVLAGECLPSAEPGRSGGGPLYPLLKPLQAIADRCRERGAAEVHRVIGKRGPLLASFEPAFRNLPGLAEYPEPAELPADAARLRIYNYIYETLAAFAEESPLVLVLDDLHWADELTLGWLRMLISARHYERMPVMLLATYRAEEQSSLGELISFVSSSRLILQRLEMPDVGRMVSDMLALSTPPSEFVAFLAARAAGNPFFVAEYLRTAVDSGVLWRSTGDRRWCTARIPNEGVAEEYGDLPLPQSIRDVVLRRLNALDAESDQIVASAAVLGREFDVCDVLNIAGISQDASAQALHQLHFRQILETVQLHRGRFTHDKIRELAYERISFDHRKTLHQRAAMVLSGRVMEGCDVADVQIGHHWEEAGEIQKANVCYLRAARRFASASALAESAKLFRKYLELARVPTVETVEARVEFGNQVLRVSGRLRDSINVLEVAVVEAQALGLPDLESRSCCWLGLAYSDLGNLDAARKWASRAVQVANERAEELEQGRSSMILGLILADMGEMQEARKCHEFALSCFCRNSRVELEAAALINLANVAIDLGELDEAETLCRRGLSIARAASRRNDEAGGLLNLSRVHSDRGEWSRADKCLVAALSLFRETGDRRHEGVILGNLALLNQFAGETKKAEEHYRESLCILADVNDQQHHALMAANFAVLRLEQGCPDESGVLLDEALATLNIVRNQRFLAVALLAKARLERMRGQSLSAKRFLTIARRKLAKVGDKLQLTIYLCEQGHAALALGRSGKTWLHRARSMASYLPPNPFGEAGRAILRLEAACIAKLNHNPIICGEAPDALPSGLRSWLLGNFGTQSPNDMY
jgi:serine/threonine protein kinase/tetratricopeptide (TPR) repeat protein